MAFPQGVNFRATAGFVTDPANYTYEISTNPNYPTTSPQGNNIGWTVTNGTTRDRNAGNDPRLAGLGGGGSADIYEIDLPSAGSYTISLAMGDANYGGSNNKAEVFDDSSSLGVLFSGASTIANSFLDATGVLRTAANWPSQNVGVSKTFSTTKCKIRIGDGVNNNSINSIFIQADAPPPPPSDRTMIVVSTNMRW